MARALLALVLLAGCEQGHHRDRPEGRDSSARTEQPAPQQPSGMVDAPGKSSDEGENP